MLTLKNISVCVGKNTALERLLIKDLSLSIPTGEFVIIIGSNGAGKSTLFNAIAGSLTIDQGSISVNNSDISQWPEYARSCVIARVLQDPRRATIDTMTIEENLSFASMRGKTRGFHLHESRKNTEFFKQKLSVLGMGLEKRLSESTAHLSGGQRQALSLIMATLNPSEILLLDEMTAALDPKIADIVMDLTAKIVREHKQTTLMITHNLAHAIEYGDRLIVLHNGSIIREYTGQEKANLSPRDLL